MRILSLERTLTHPTLHIERTTLKALRITLEQTKYDYLIIHGGDGTIRRTIQTLHQFPDIPTLIINPTGSFNVIAKQYRTPPLSKVLKALEEGEVLPTAAHRTYRLNEMSFLFSAGNMGDLQHIFLSESLRFGWLKKGLLKYLLALIFLLPVHLVITPFMLASTTRFFIFTPLRSIKKFGSFYGEVPHSLTIDLQNNYNLIELDGDIVTITDSILHIKEAEIVEIVTKM